jgi:sugar phosphate isomerase/epimerase
MANTVLGVGYTLASNYDDFAFEQLGARLDEAEVLGVDFVELPLYAMDLIAGGRVLHSRVKLAKAIIAGRSLRYTVHGPMAINLMDVPERLPRHQDVLKAALEIASEFGALHFVLHGGIYDENRSSISADDLYAQQRDILSAFAEEAERLGVIITVETLFTTKPGLRTALPSRLALDIAAIAHSHIWACLDFSHSYINSAAHGVDPAKEVATLAPFAKHLHIHDSFGRPTQTPTYFRPERLAYGEGDLHLPLGLGTIPWDELMRRLQFPGGVVFNIELPPPYWSEIGTVIEKTRRMAAEARTAGS